MEKIVRKRLRNSTLRWRPLRSMVPRPTLDIYVKLRGRRSLYLEKLQHLFLAPLPLRAAQSRYSKVARKLRFRIILGALAIGTLACHRRARWTISHFEFRTDW